MRRRRRASKPGAPDSGIVFRRVDLDDQPTIAADARLVSGVEWETVIGEGERVVRTVEHLLAALAAHRLDNLEIELDGSEPPALDGSAAGWCRAITRPGSRPRMRPPGRHRPRDDHGHRGRTRGTWCCRTRASG